MRKAQDTILVIIGIIFLIVGITIGQYILRIFLLTVGIYVRGKITIGFIDWLFKSQLEEKIEYSKYSLIKTWLLGVLGGIILGIILYIIIITTGGKDSPLIKDSDEGFDNYEDFPVLNLRG